MPGFIPDIATLLAFALAAIVLAITPGPDMALQLSRVINYGRAHGFATAAGALTGTLVHTTLVALGISVLIVAAPAFRLNTALGVTNVGASATATTLTLTVAVAVPPWPSEIV